MANPKRGVILMNLGSPDSTGVYELRKYLNEFLTDKRVIDASWFFRKIFVQGVIVPLRAPKSAEAYKVIWTENGSPLIHPPVNWLKIEPDYGTKSISMRYGSSGINGL
jgi:ferrochelatase